MFEKKQKQTKQEVQQEAEKKLASEALPGFRKDYGELVQKYGWIHGIRWTQPSSLAPSQPFITEIFIKKEIDKAKQNQAIEDNIVVKN